MPNKSLALNLFLLSLGMLALAYASVPLYRLFCATTGYGGTTREGQFVAGPESRRTITVDFNADTDPGLPWEFKPGERKITVRPGKQMLTHYVARNLTGESVKGHAVYNVVPFSAGQYFVKIDCFCFTEQTLEPHQQVNMPVVFYVDPAIDSDPAMKDVKTITLSYTFFPVKKSARD